MKPIHPVLIAPKAAASRRPPARGSARRPWAGRRVLEGLAGALLAAGVHAQPASQVFRGADLALGTRLIAEHRCTACHVSKFGGDGSSIYRPAGRINTPASLSTMVERCNTELNLGMFPEDVTAVAAVLNRDHYHFK